MTFSPKRIDIIPSPALFNDYPYQGAHLIMVDAIRASASIATALHYGASYIRPLASVEEARSYKQQGYLIAAERDSLIVPGFDLGNSPYEYMQDHIRGSKIAMTTTNGTHALKTAHGYASLVVGGFINYQAILNYCLSVNGPIMVLCSGWKNKLNAEDVLFGGKLMTDLLQQGHYQPASDMVPMAMELFQNGKNNIYDYVLHLSPRLKGKEADLGRDMQYCLQDQYINQVPVFKEDRIKPL